MRDVNELLPAADAVGVIGAGLMGTGIAAVFAAAGIDVLLHDTVPEHLARAPAELRRIAAELEEAALLSAADAASLPSRVHGVTDLGALAGRSFVLKAAPERVEIKRSIYAALEGVVTDKLQMLGAAGKA